MEDGTDAPITSTLYWIRQSSSSIYPWHRTRVSTQIGRMRRSEFREPVVVEILGSMKMVRPVCLDSILRTENWNHSTKSSLFPSPAKFAAWKTLPATACQSSASNSESIAALAENISDLHRQLSIIWAMMLQQEHTSIRFTRRAEVDARTTSSTLLKVEDATYGEYV